MYIFWDTETTGLPKNWSAPVTDFNNWPRIVSIAWLIYDYSGKLITEAYHVVKAEPGYVFDPKATAVHGITYEQSRKIGVPLKTVMDAFLQDAERCTHMIAHNFDFDSAVTRCELHRLGMKDICANKESICTMKHGEVIKYCNIPNERGGKKWPKLEEMYEKLFNQKFADAHNSLADIRATAHCFFELQKLGIIEQHVVPSLSDADDEQEFFNEVEPDDWAEPEGVAFESVNRVPVQMNYMTKEQVVDQFGDQLPEDQKQEVEAQIKKKRGRQPKTVTSQPATILTKVRAGAPFASEIGTHLAVKNKEIPVAEVKTPPATVKGPTLPPGPPLPPTGTKNTALSGMQNFVKGNRDKKFDGAVTKQNDGPGEPYEPQVTQTERPINNPATALVKTSGVPEDQAMKIVSSLDKFFAKADEWEQIIDKLVITSVDDVDGMKACKQGRLVLKNARLDADKIIDQNRAAIKEEIAPYLAEDKLWLEAGKIKDARFKPLETKLKEKEEYAERVAAEAKAKIQAARLAEITPFMGELPVNFDYAALSNEEWLKTLQGAKDLHQAKLDAIEKEKKEAEAKAKAREKLFGARLAQLEDVKWDGKAATYEGRTVISAESLSSISDTAFEAVVEGHKRALDKSKQDAFNAKMRRRVERMDELGFVIVDTPNDCEYFFREELILTHSQLEGITDEDFDAWINQYVEFIRAENKAKDAELESANQKAMQERDLRQKQVADFRKKRLLDLGLEFDGTVFSYGGKQYTSLHSVTGSTDETFEANLVTYKKAIFEDAELKKAEAEAAKKQETLQQLAETSDLDKADILIVGLDEVSKNVLELSFSSPQGKKMAAGTRQLLGKITAWLITEKEKLK